MLIFVTSSMYLDWYLAFHGSYHIEEVGAPVYGASQVTQW